MKVYAPDYYNDFICIADKCRHSCCIGWEIDIDDDTYMYYKSMSGDFAKRLSLSTAVTDNTAHFVLTKDERCPFLNKNGLCDIITELGENNLCQICADHPRFRNFFDDREEIGLGLCCEAAGRLILTRQNKAAIIEIENDGENKSVSADDSVFFSFRNRIFDIITNRTMLLSDRVQLLISEYDIHIPQKSLSDWADVYLALERLDSIWTNRLDALKNISDISVFANEEPQIDIAFEQLLFYFIYRHTADGLYDDRFSERIAFAILSIYIIYALYNITPCKDSTDLSELIEIARLYSSEIEYSEENINCLLEILSN